MPRPILALIAVLVSLSLSAQDEAVFKVKTPIERPIFRLPQYVPVVGRDTINVITLDTMPAYGSIISLWTPKAIVVSYNLVLVSKGEIFKTSGPRDILTYGVNFLDRAKATGGTVFLYITEIYCNEKVSKCDWTYQIKVK